MKTKLALPASNHSLLTQLTDLPTYRLTDYFASFLHSHWRRAQKPPELFELLSHWHQPSSEGKLRELKLSRHQNKGTTGETKAI